MSDARRTLRPSAGKGFRLIGPLAGPALNLRPVVFNESQRRAIRRAMPVPLDDRTFSQFIQEAEHDAALHVAFRQRTRLSEAAIMHRFLIYNPHLARAATTLKRLKANADLADYLQPFVRQPFTEEEYWQSIVKSATTPAKGVPINVVPGDDDFERALKEVHDKATAHAKAEGRLPLERVSIEELLAAAETSLKQIEDIVNRALFVLRRQPRKGGRGRDAWRMGLISRLATIYEKCVGRPPSSTANNDFHRLVKIIFDALKWPPPDHRMIIKVLKTLKGAKT